MRIVLILHGGRTVPLREEPDRAEASCACPSCGDPLAVVGDGRRRSDCDRYYFASGYCTGCGEQVGEIRAYPSTLFGIEEDERVLVRGCARVY